MNNAYLSQPVVKWLRERESTSLSGSKYKEAADRIEELEAYILSLHAKLYPDSVPPSILAPRATASGGSEHGAQ